MLIKVKGQTIRQGYREVTGAVVGCAQTESPQIFAPMGASLIRIKEPWLDRRLD